MLQWMAFAFFSPYAVNSHNKVDLTTSGMSVQDATAVAQVLNASNPLRLLLDSSESKCKLAHLLEQVTLLEPNGLRPTHLSAGTVVWVVHDQQNSSRIQVLVPGHGVHAIEHTKLSTPAKASPKQPVSQLTLTIFNDDDETGDYEGLVPLLNVIASQVTSLTVDLENDSPVLLADKIPGILQACPLLKYLELRHVDGDGIDCIVDAFETGACKLSALNLNGVVITDGVESLFHIFKALMNPKTAIAQQLKELHVRTSASGAWLVRQLRGVLDRNHGLQTVFVSAAKKRLDQANVSLQDLEPVYFAQPHRPFPLRSKLSLLSVADEASAGVNPIVQDALSRLNRTVFQQIFEYAAPPMERVVRAVEDRNPLPRRRNEDL